MKKFTLLILSFIFGLTTAFAQITEIDGVIGYWDFDNVDDIFLNQATQEDIAGAPSFIEDIRKRGDDGTDIVSTKDTDWLVILGDVAGTKALHLKANNWMKLFHNIGKNGLDENGDPATYVNEYSIVMDVKVADASGTYGLMEINPTSSSSGEDEAEWEIEAGAIGTVCDLDYENVTGFSTSAPVLSGYWHRLAFVAKLDEYVKFYVDGELFLSADYCATTYGCIDGAASGWHYEDYPGEAALRLGGVHNDRDGDKDIDAVLLLNRYLSDAEVEELGYPANESTGIDLYNAAISLKLFPNPAHDVLHYSVADAEELEIINISGQQIMTVKLDKPSSSLNISHLNSGIYVVRISRTNGSFESRKLVVK